MVGGLGEALLDTGSDIAPFAEGKVDFLGVFAFFPGNGAEEGDDVVGDLVLDCGTITYGVYIAERSSDEAEV